LRRFKVQGSRVQGDLEAGFNSSSRSKPHGSSKFKGSTFNDHTPLPIFRNTLCSGCAQDGTRLQCKEGWPAEG